MENSRFFKSITGDRLYTADNFAEYFRSFLTTGIFELTELGVTASAPASMIVHAGSGDAMIEGYYYSNTADVPLTITGADAVNPRIDRIVLRLDVNDAVRTIVLAVLTGTPAASPAAPALTTNFSVSGKYEISLAQIAIAANATTIATDDITDERASIYCGKVAMQGNSGDETTATIKTKLGISTLSGSNTGDETTATIKTKLGISTLSGSNTGDETATKIGALIGSAGDATPNDTDFVATSLTSAGILKKITWTNVKVFLKSYFDGVYTGSLGDMILSSIQSVTGLKTFYKEKIAMKGTSTGTNVISVSNTSATNYTNTLPAKDGTFAMLDDNPAETLSTIGALIGSAGDATPNDTDFVATSLTSAGILKKITWTNVKVFLKTWIQATSFALLQYKQSQTTVQSLTDGATITPDWDNGQMATITLSDNRTLASPTNLKVGTTMRLKVMQDGTGSRSLAYGSIYKWFEGETGMLSTTGFATDIIEMTCFDIETIYCTIKKNYNRSFDVNHIAVWKMNESSGTSVADTKGTYPLTAESGTLITTNAFGGYARQGDGLHKILHASSAIIPGNAAKTVRFKFKCTSASLTLFMSNYGSVSSGEEIAILANGTISFTSYNLGTIRCDVASNFNACNSIEYDVQYSWDGTQNANSLKLYIKCLTGANAEKWVNSTGTAYSNTIVAHATATPSGVPAAGNGIFAIMGRNVDNNFKFNNGYIYDVQVSNIARTDMLNYV